MSDHTNHYLFDELHDTEPLNELNKRRFTSRFINIDSSYRIKTPQYDFGEGFLLNKNPLQFTNKSNSIQITHHDHSYKPGNKIKITNVTTQQYTLRTINKLPTFEIKQNSNIMKIIHKHNIPHTNNNNNNPTATPTPHIKLTGIKGDRGTNNISFLGDIPINILNTTHKIHLQIDPNHPPSPNHFYIILPKVMHLTYTLKKYNFKLMFLSLCGIGLNKINGDHTITKTTQHSYTIKLPHHMGAYKTTKSGGSCVNITLIKHITCGYPHPNNYKISLGHTYHNIVHVKLVDIYFPKNHQTINAKNNKLYWNNIDDGDHMYHITIPPGNYTPTELTNTMTKLFYNVPRINTDTPYEPKHIIHINTNKNTHVTTFKSFKKYYLTNSFTTISPEISTNPLIGINPPDTIYTITIHHPNHNMTPTSPHNTITIKNAINHLGIPSSYLNQQHKVTKIIDKDHYNIKIKRINLDDLRQNTKGGVNVIILIADKFRILTCESDTITTIMGFNKTTTTPFKTVISTKCIQLCNPHYVIMVANPLTTLHNIGPIKNAFAKILLCNKKPQIDNFAHTYRNYDDPLDELSQLDIAFHNPDGTLYNFCNIDHSFVIQIITVNDLPNGSGINLNTGNNYDPFE